MVVSDELTLRLLSIRRAWTDPRRLSTAVTALLLLEPDMPHFHAALKGLRASRYQLDSKLIADLYAVLPKGLRIDLLASMAGRHLDTKTFRALFVPLYRDRSLMPKQRRPAETLHRQALIRELQPAGVLRAWRRSPSEPPWADPAAKIFGH